MAERDTEANVTKAEVPKGDDTDALVVVDELTPREKFLHKAIEISRMSIVMVSIGLGMSREYYRLFAGLFVVAMDFTLGLQIFFLSDLSRKVFKWPKGGPYTRQSGCQFLASGTAMIVLLAIQAPDPAVAAVAFASTTYFLFGGVNHIMTERHYAKRDGRPPVKIHYFRFFGSLAVAALNYLIIFGYWKALI